MAEDEALPFDPSMKKKKKKKKTTFDLDAVLGDGSAAMDGAPTEHSTSQENIPEDQTQEQPVDKIDDELSLDLASTKKKKKKKKPIDVEEIQEALLEVNEKDTNNQMDGIDATMNEDDDLNLSLPTKKKKKKKKVNIEDMGDDDDADAGDDDEGTDAKDDKMSDNITGLSKAWYGTSRDYIYDELLTRVFDIIREKNPDMVAGEKKRYVMRPPQVLRVGTKKSSFANFSEICRLLHREPKHVLAFLLAELGTSGSIDGNNQLIIKGRFQQKQIETVVRKYIKEYVTCHTCRSPDTLLQKDTRLFFLQCETCGSRCSVTSIKSGFQAVTGKRAAIRAKNN